MSKKNLDFIPYEIIIRAQQADYEALNFIISYFTEYIKKLATRTETNRYGDIYSFVDEDIVSELQNKLVISIVNDFRLPI